MDLTEALLGPNELFVEVEGIVPCVVCIHALGVTLLCYVLDVMMNPLSFIILAPSLLVCAVIFLYASPLLMLRTARMRIVTEKMTPVPIVARGVRQKVSFCAAVRCW